MISIHESTITAVPTNNGLGNLLPTECIVTQEINGEYELEMTHPRDEYGKWERLANDRILYVPTPDGAQLFRIYRTKKNIKGEIEVKARHIFYDLLGNIIEYLDISAQAGEAAIDSIFGATQYATTFTSSSDIATASSAVYVRKNPVQILLGDDDNGWLKKWGGEISRDNFSTAMNTAIGADNGRVVAYKKNLTGVDAQEDYANVVTRIMPTGLNTDDTVLYLDPSKYVDSAHINDYPHPRIKHVHFSDVKVKADGDYTSVAAARAELSARANALLALSCDLPEVSIDVEFQELGDTEEYQQYVNLSTIQLGDTVTVQHDDLNIDLDLRVVSYEWDALKERHNSIRLGALRPNIGSSVVDIDVDLSALREDYSNAVKQGETYNEVKITHTNGFESYFTTGGKTLGVRMNGANGFQLLDGSTVVGSFKVIDGKARLVTDIIAGNGEDVPTYISLEQEADGIYWRPALRFYRDDGSGFVEYAKLYGRANDFYMEAFPTSTTGDTNMKLIVSQSSGGVDYSHNAWVLLSAGAGTPKVALYSEDTTTSPEHSTKVELTPTTIKFYKNGSVVETW